VPALVEVEDENGLDEASKVCETASEREVGKDDGGGLVDAAEEEDAAVEVDVIVAGRVDGGRVKARGMTLGRPCERTRAFRFCGLASTASAAEGTTWEGAVATDIGDDADMKVDKEGTAIAVTPSFGMRGTMLGNL